MNLRRIVLKKLALIVGLSCSVLTICSAARSETLVTDLSQHVIEITSQFSGSDLLLFGALERYVADSTQSEEITIQGLGYDIIVVVQGEPTDLIIRKKEKVAGIWINNDDRTIRNVPGFYVIGSTRPLDEFLPKETQISYGLGLNNINILSDGYDDVGEYKEALIRNMINKGLYSENDGNVTVKDEILFRANLAFPSNVPVGNYNADVYLVRNGEIIINHRTDLLVDKRGFERLIYNFAHEYPPYYGIIAVFVAISVGLFSGFVARKVT